MTDMFKYDKVLPMNTGVEAVETALKLCRKWAYEKKGIPSNKAKIVFASGNFHGRTMAVISASEKGVREDGGPLRSYAVVVEGALPALRPRGTVANRSPSGGVA